MFGRVLSEPLETLFPLSASCEPYTMSPPLSSSTVTLWQLAIVDRVV